MNNSVHTPHTFLSPQPTHRNKNVFQPPSSPALSSSNDYFSSHRSRKRSRHDSVDGRNSAWATTPSQTPAAQSWIQCPTPSDGVYGSACVGSGGLVNERYLLRDGFDTPGLMAGGMGYHQTDEGRWRSKMGDQDVGGGRSEGRLLSGPLARERNGVARTRSSPAVPTQKQQSWTGFAFGLVGKVFSFGTGVFRGFYAGGGQGYNVSGTPAPSSRPSRPRLSRGNTPVPGAWRDDDFMGDFEQDNPTFSSPDPGRPPNKRRQTDKDSWVMVGTPDLPDTSPRRKVSSTSIPRAGTPGTRPTTASRASSRRSIAPAISRRQSSYVSHSGSPANLNITRQRGDLATFAPTRSRPSSSHDQQAYVSPEAEKFVRRQAKQDRANDKAMSSMSKQLQDLIRQGQEALGTKFDVDGGGYGDEDMDEGYVDEDEAGWR